MFNFFKQKFNIEIKRLDNSLNIIANINGKKISSMKCVVEEKVILIGDIEPFQNHKERLLHFYTKLGFEIKLYDVMIDYNFGELRILI